MAQDITPNVRGIQVSKFPYEMGNAFSSLIWSVMCVDCFQSGGKKINMIEQAVAIATVMHAYK